MAKARITYLSETEKEFVHEKTLEVLEKVGVAYNTPKAIELLEAAGARVDREALTARLTWDVIEPALKTVPRTVLLAGRDPARDCVLGGDRLITTSDGMTTYMLDDVTGERRDGTTADLADVTRLCDALGEIDTLWPSPNPGDAPADVLPLITQADDGAQHHQARPGRGAHAGDGRADPRDLRGRLRRAAHRAPVLLGDQLHHRAAAARQGHDRGRAQDGAPRGADLRAARCRRPAPRGR